MKLANWESLPGNSTSARWVTRITFKSPLLFAIRFDDACDFHFVIYFTIETQQFGFNPVEVEKLEVVFVVHIIRPNGLNMTGHSAGDVNCLTFWGRGSTRCCRRSGGCRKFTRNWISLRRGLLGPCVCLVFTTMTKHFRIWC